ncbi:2-octaprenyl-6-methoxyphenyl hydroxylase [Pseudoxanthomonas composti]|uniref:2-octaprenyl-6-methoxyphenyl hydroxylase n=1 Tax=Pseudoxanthomonas composti TaxID=2137479 RepID=A0A4Q1JTR0_9GAMM|nr:2-octaprenyl-6-methoxyphenyl hydroxylase [Pseudoxanthomonas composti]RXR04368.1 2-octaprenyl-6-methoxyphenyl hydroxylase [Pseudoxanthomonas composti]
MSKQHDVVIVGGGLVGASLAIALDRAGRDVGLVEAAGGQGMPPVFDQRNLSFAAATVNALTALGVMQQLQAPTGAIARIHVSRRGDFGRIVLEAADYGRQAFGQVVVASDFGQALERSLALAGGITRYRPARFEALAGLDDGSRRIRISGPDGTQALSARLLVGADGSASQVRDALGIGAQEYDYGQTLCVARMRAERAPDGTAYERLTRDGPTAVLPRGDRHYGVIHAVPSAQADAVAALTPAQWCARIQDAFGWRVGRFFESGERSAYAIRQRVAERLTAPRAVLMGNAAQTLHPVGAQGFNLGLRDALTLAELIQASDDPGNATLLETYLQRRGEDRRRTLAFSDGLARLTSSDVPLMAPLRSLGLLVAGQASWVQAMLAGGGMGFRGHVPALCREEAA